MAKRRPTLMRLGSVSYGTMRPEDLIPSFLWECKRIRLTQVERNTVRDIARQTAGFAFIKDRWTADQQEVAGMFLSALFDILDAHCPDFCTFGAHEGDGSDYGVWPCIEDAQEASHVSPNAPGEDVTETRGVGMAYWFHVNDHGNSTLYHRAGNRWVEVWSVV